MHRVLLGQHSTDSWYAECADCDWCWCVPGESPDAMHEAAEQHGEIVPGGYMPRAYVEALVLAVMEPLPGTEGE
jgi:hypothetical protein